MASPTSSSPAPDEVSWERVRNSTDQRDVRDHLDSFPDSPTAPAARTLLEELIWRGILVAPTVNKLDIFTDEFRDGRYYAEARLLFEQLITGAATGPVVNPPAANVAKQPRNPEVSSAVRGAASQQRPEPRKPAPAPLPDDEADWERIKNSEIKQDFRRHIEQFPDSITAPKAHAKLDMLIWRELSAAPAIDGLQEFLQEFPNSRNAASASDLLQQLRASAAWTSTVQAGRLEDFQSFIQAHPDSRHVGEAEAMLAQLAAAARPVVESPLIEPPDEPESIATSTNDDDDASRDAGASAAHDESASGLESNPADEQPPRRVGAGWIVAALLLVAGGAAAMHQLDLLPSSWSGRSQQATQTAPAPAGISSPTPAPIAGPVPQQAPATQPAAILPDTSMVDARLRREGAPLSSRLEIAVVWDGREDFDLSVTCPGGTISADIRNGCGGAFGNDVSGPRSNQQHIEYATWMAPPNGSYSIRVKYQAATDAARRVRYLLRVKADGAIRVFEGVMSVGEIQTHVVNFP